MFLKKLKIKMPYGLATPFLDMYPKEFKAGSQRYICTPVFTATLFTIAKKLKWLKCLTNECINKM